jgi:hypothetical protein
MHGRILLQVGGFWRLIVFLQLSISPVCRLLLGMVRRLLVWTTGLLRYWGYPGVGSVSLQIELVFLLR